MSIPGTPDKAKLVIGILSAKKRFINEAAVILSDTFGPIDIVSPWMSFEYTRYYEKEMGWPLFRRMLSFSGLVEQKELSDIKIKTNEIERNFIRENLRKVNIDPGILLPSRFILATGKDFSHRVYLDKGIYADLTLIYYNDKKKREQGYKILPWTYPDYAEEEMIEYLLLARKRYKSDIKLKGNRE